MNRICFVFASFLSAPPALSSPSDATQAHAPLEEIVVMAQKREQSLQDVGIAVTALSGEQIGQLRIVNSTDVAAMTPGLNYTVPNGESSQINFFLRGVGLNDFADANENPVAVYVDEVYRPAMGGLSFQLFDMDRVEVLRGPQGSLFGRNALGNAAVDQHILTWPPIDRYLATDVRGRTVKADAMYAQRDGEGLRPRRRSRATRGQHEDVARWSAARRFAEGAESIDTRYCLLSEKPEADGFRRVVRAQWAIENADARFGRLDCARCVHGRGPRTQPQR